MATTPVSEHAIPCPKREEIVKEGWLLKQSRYLHDWRRRWIVLTKNALYSYKGASSKLDDPTEALPLAQCTSVRTADDAGKPFAFRVDSPQRVFLLVASNAAEKEAWIGALGRQMVVGSRHAVYSEEDVIY